jgi:hypothetical protein
VNSTKPTGKPNIPLHVRKAKDTQLAMEKQAHVLALNDKEYVFCCCSLPLGSVDVNVLTLSKFCMNGVGAAIPMLLDDSTQDTQNGNKEDNDNEAAKDDNTEAIDEDEGPHPFCLEWGLVPRMFSHPVLWKTSRLVHLRGPCRLAPINLVLRLAHPPVPQ